MRLSALNWKECKSHIKGKEVSVFYITVIACLFSLDCASHWLQSILRLFWTRHFRNFDRFYLCAFVFLYKSFASRATHTLHVFLEWVELMSLSRDKATLDYMEYLFIQVMWHWKIPKGYKADPIIMITPSNVLNLVIEDNTFLKHI